MVYLVGAGPGDPGLITVKGLELIKKADCLVYDGLASRSLLDYARADCEKIYVGKADSSHSPAQEEINELLKKKAAEYRCVVRLKGGDPFVFGRGAEEGLYLNAHGISFTVVPGVSSAIAGAACAGIPVTHRDMASSFRVITAHRMNEESIDYSSMLDENETLVFLKGHKRVEEIAGRLMAAGRTGETPAAVISNASTEVQRICTGNLSNIAEKVKTAALTSPSVIVVGNVVTLRKHLMFFEHRPLWGQRYLVPKIGNRPSELASLLRERGAFVQECCVGEIVGIHAAYTRQEIAKVDILLFTSANGVEYFMRSLFASGLDVRVLSHVKTVVIGNKTAQKLLSYGLCSDLIPEKPDSVSLVKALKEFTAKQIKKDPFSRISIWYPAAKNAKDDLVDALLEIGECGRLNVYENTACLTDEVDFSDFDGIFFTCASAAERLLGGKTKEELVELNTRLEFYSIGPQCSRALSGLGLTVKEASVSSYQGLVNIVMPARALPAQITSRSELSCDLLNTL